MLRNLKTLEKFVVSASDGDIGHVVNFFVDDQQWVVRHLVVETGGLLDRQRVMISPISFRNVDWSMRRFHVALTKGQILKSPNINLDKPVSRQHETEYYAYYGYPSYWTYTGPWGTGAFPSLLAAAGRTHEVTSKTGRAPADIHLRSANELCGYHIQGTDDAIGHIADFIFDDETWQVRYFVIDTRNWWVGKHVLFVPQWVTGISWEERKVHVGVSRQMIKYSPAWNAIADLTRDYEARLFDYYDKPGYWVANPSR